MMEALESIRGQYCGTQDNEFKGKVMNDTELIRTHYPRQLHSVFKDYIDSQFSDFYEWRTNEL